MTRMFWIVGFCLLASACGTGKDNDEAPSAPAARGLAGLPEATLGGRRVPYLRYGNTTPDAGLGTAIFLHPIMGQRNGFRALEYDTRSDRPVEELFGEELFGVSGTIVLRDNVIRVESLPIALPDGVGNGQEWTIEYGGRRYLCRSSIVAPTDQSTLTVTCSGRQHNLTFSFNRERGVVEYQDFCGDAVCSYRLLDPKGLLAPEVQDYMNLPRIQN